MLSLATNFFYYYCFLFDDTKNFAYIHNECAAKKLPFISLNNSEHTIGQGDYSIISNNTGFSSSIYFAKFFYNVIKNEIVYFFFNLILINNKNKVSNNIKANMFFYNF